MIRYLAIAAVCLAGLGGVGYVLAHRGSAATPAAREAVKKPSPAVGSAGSAVEPAAAHVVVVALSGNVEKRVGETWVPLAKGDTLDVRDAIRTDPTATAQIDFGDVSIDLDHGTEVTVGEATHIAATATANVVLGEGRVSAGGKGKVRIQVRNSDAVAEAENSQFAVATTGNGDIVATADTGVVKLTAHGASVDVHAGEVSSAAPDAAPAVPTKIPASLFLKVSASTGGKQAVVRGETAPGAIVSINGVRTLTPDGKFETKVAVKEGKNTFVVLVEDVRGRHEEQTLERLVQNRGPKLGAEVEWGQ